MKVKKSLRVPALTFVFIGLLLAGCAQRPVTQDGITINDPFEAQNRRVHSFNKAVDTRLLSPVANRLRGSGDDAPRRAHAPGDPIGPLQMMVNAGRNLSLPGKTVNGLLQGRPDVAGRNLARFLVNSTVGLGGLFDPAGENLRLTERDTDFGETLAVWGLPEGAYLELPLIGPSTVRDAAGRVVDLAIDPVNHVLSGRDRQAAFALRVVSKAGERARFGDTVDSVLQGSADSYAQLRLIWLMNRRHELGEERADFDPYDDEGAFDPYDD
ncbi:MAG: VacJ family lipoprotein [Paracoccus sp. (in: a-proteobacteria)]|uniref:MlaA family lipoprotein n=1 Tax=Paracoccus sp. TaxID=267 RepID=UPI003918865B